MCTAFRDGFQSVYGARVLTRDFMPAVKAAYDAGIRWFEAGGGARFQSCYFYCNEDAFWQMDEFRKACPEADLQTLGRGVNVVGLDSQSSDMIRLHAQLFKKHGISSIRNFDALNDVNNLVHPGRTISEAGLKHEIAITLMGLPPGLSGAHDPAFYERVLKQIMDAGIAFDRICFKDASGTATPRTVFETIQMARRRLPGNMHMKYHTHETAGNGVACYLAAIEAGADGLDLSMSPVSGGTCQPDIIVMWHALRGSNFDLGVDVDKIRKAEEVFRDCMKEYFLPPEALSADPAIIWSPMPGGALTANTQMLRDNNMLDRYQDLIDNMNEVVARGGFGTSVTPVSQFYVQQAFNNVLFGKWKRIAEGYGKMVLGYFGRTPVAPDPEIVKVASEQLHLPPTTKTVLEINDADPTKGVKAATKLLTDAGLPVTDENVFIAGTCREKGITFLQGKATLGIRKQAPAAATPVSGSAGGKYTVTVSGKTYGVELRGDKATVNGRDYNIAVTDGLPQAAAPQAAPQAAAGACEIKAPVPGIVLRLSAQPGDQVK
ncbi:MAG: biotin attachment protein, partial [Kiritimatiellae bacterium]|nr:biotin attachment protein [Kiritimatiellia bacterium]